MPDPQHIAVLEQIIRARRSVRSFSGQGYQADIQPPAPHRCHALGWPHPLHKHQYPCDSGLKKTGQVIPCPVTVKKFIY